MFQRVYSKLVKFLNQMSAASSGELPIFFVCGATGTGKTKLGVELASLINGEVINVDAIQMYRGLDIATNKVTTEEMKGIPHHLIGFLDPHLEDFTIHRFQAAALSLISEINERGKSAVLVGGTHYYLESVLWHFLEGSPPSFPFSHNRTQFPDLSSDELHRQLGLHDPDAAARIHPRDRRKVLNALILAEKGKTKEKSEGLRFPGRVIGFWTDSKKDVLHERLDKRVDEMMLKGLVSELKAFHEEENQMRDDWKERKKDRYEAGIWQAIGFKELEPFLSMSAEEQEEEEGRRILRQSTRRLKLSTRQYSRRQLKWINNRFLIHNESNRVPIFRLDTSDPSQWPTAVTEKVEAVYDFWRKKSPEERKDAGKMDWWEECSVTPEPVRVKTQLTYVAQRCDDCNKVFNIQEEFDIHMRSKGHKKCVTAKRKRKMKETIAESTEGSEKQTKNSLYYENCKDFI